MDGGGAPNTQPGYGPNTRTIMQIRVAGTPAPTYDLAALNAVFAKTPTKRGVFEVSQDPIIIPQAAYNSAYNNTFRRALRVSIYRSQMNRRLSSLQRERGSSACRHAATADEGDA